MAGALIHRNATPMRGPSAAQWFRMTFALNGWSGDWLGSVHEWHHYHMNTHEVLGVVSGAARLQFDGPQGRVETVHAGDAIVIPAACAHCLIEATDDFEVIGAYPGGLRPDIHNGSGAIAPFPLPVRRDPILGAGRGFVLHIGQAGVLQG